MWLFILAGSTLAEHGVFPSWWKYQSVQCPCVLSDSGGVAVSLSGVTGPECHCPRKLQTTVSPWKWLVPGMWSHFLLDWPTRHLPGAAYEGSLHLLVRRSTGVRIKTQSKRDSCRVQADSGAADPGNKIRYVTIFSQSWLRQEQWKEDWKLQS